MEQFEVHLNDEFVYYKHAVFHSQFITCELL